MSGERDRELIERALAGPLAAVADEVRAAVLPSFRLRRAAGGGDAGHTRLGGLPDLPPATPWPARDDGRPLGFVAQVLVAEAPDPGPLPEGLLVFFYDTDPELQSWGFDPADRDGHRMLHFAPGTNVEQAAPPAGLDLEQSFRPGPLTFSPELTLPEHYDPRAPALPEELHDAYSDLVDALSEQHEEDGGPLHRLLGHADQVQGEMATECQLVTNGLYLGDRTGWDDPRADALRAGAADWRLVLQLDSEFDAPEVTWGDGGRIFFWAREDDLRAGRLERGWALLQTS